MNENVQNAIACKCQYLAITASDSLNSILDLHFFLEIASEGSYSAERRDLLLQTYLNQSAPHFQSLKRSLKALRGGDDS